jgi:hypothetical protein
MIRVLAIIAVVGFLMSVVCLSAAVAIGGPDVTHGVWTWREHTSFFGPWRHWDGDGRPQAQREFPWTGERLQVDAPADIEFVQAAGPAKLVVRGPAWAIDRVQVEGGRISLAHGARWAPLHITLTAPKVTNFELNGDNRLKITGYNQDALTLAASGRADIEAAGEAKTVSLYVSGAGDADLAALKTAGADIAISGAAAATLGPTEWARVAISGMGSVDLLTRPKRLEEHISGAGRVHQPGDDGATGAPQGGDDGRGPERPT